jgi:hypothetical protein
MNFIISIIMFALLSLGSFTASTHTTPGGNWNYFYLGCSVVLGLVSIIMLIVMVFRQMEFQKEARELVNEIRSNKDYIIKVKEQLSCYKTELQDALTKVYPNYEKEIFKEMNPSDSENLSAILVKYPELKFNSVLKDYTDTVKTYLNRINEIQTGIIRDRRMLQDITANNWKLIGTNVPQDVMVD